MYYFYNSVLRKRRIFATFSDADKYYDKRFRHSTLIDVPRIIPKILHATWKKLHVVIDKNNKY